MKFSVLALSELQRTQSWRHSSILSILNKSQPQFGLTWLTAESFLKFFDFCSYGLGYQPMPLSSATLPGLSNAALLFAAMKSGSCCSHVFIHTECGSLRQSQLMVEEVGMVNMLMLYCLFGMIPRQQGQMFVYLYFDFCSILILKFTAFRARLQCPPSPSESTEVCSWCSSDPSLCCL
jgi:hypothetical protein